MPLRIGTCASEGASFVFVLFVFRFFVQVILKSGTAEIASGTVAAAIAGNAVVAGQCTLSNNVEDAKIVGEFPGFGFVNPHQRCVDDELLLHGHVERHVETADEGVAAVGIARKVGLAYTGHNVEGANFASVNGGDAQEEEVTAGHEGVGQRVGGFLLVHDDRVVGKGVVVELRDERNIHQAERHVVIFADAFGELDLDTVLLTVDEGDGVDLLEVVLCPEKAGGGVLAAAEDDECAVAACSARETQHGLGKS